MEDETDAELFVDLTDESREDGVRSIAVFEVGTLRRIDISRQPDGTTLIEITEEHQDRTYTSIRLSRSALDKLVRGLVRFDFVSEDALK